MVHKKFLCIKLTREPCCNSFGRKRQPFTQCKTHPFAEFYGSINLGNPWDGFHISNGASYTNGFGAVVLFPFPPVDWFLFRVCNVLLKFKKGNIMNNVSACSFRKMFRCHVTSP